MRNLKILGLAFVAVLAMSAMVASAAQASKFTAAEYPATITGEQEGGSTANRLTVGGAFVTCAQGNYHGTLSEASSTLSVSLDYTECETSFGTSATVDNNGCGYTFHSGAGAEDTWAGTADLVCPAGQELTVTLGLCTVHVAPQANLGGITFTNKTEASPKDVTVEAETPVVVNVTNVFLCPLATGVQNGTLDTKVTVKAYKDTGGTEGAQIDTFID